MPSAWTHAGRERTTTRSFRASWPCKVLERYSSYAPSSRSSHSLRSSPPAYPLSDPSAATTRWHGTIIEMGLRATAPPTWGHNRSLVSRHTMSSRNTLGDLTIRSDLATRDRKQLKPNLALKRRTNHMQRRRKPRLLPRKISIQPRPRTLKHRRSRAICRTHRRHPTGTRNRIGTYDILRILFEQRRAKVLLPLKPKPRQTAAISGKQDFAQRRSKRRRDHQRLLSKLRTIIPRIVQTTSQIRPDRLDCPREGVFPLNIGRYRVATPKTMSGKNEGEWFSEK